MMSRLYGIVSIAALVGVSMGGRTKTRVYDAQLLLVRCVHVENYVPEAGEQWVEHFGRRRLHS